MLVAVVLCAAAANASVVYWAVSADSESLFVAADIVEFVRGPTVNLVTNESAVIFWRTSEPCNSSVDYGLSNVSLSMTVENSSLTQDHYSRLEGLSIDTKYYYRVESNGTASPIYHFRTAPADGEKFRMVVLGDNRPGTGGFLQPETFGQIINMTIAEEPHIVVMTGDYVYAVTTDLNWNLDAWAHFTELSDQLGHYAPIYGVMGNHDTGAATGMVHSEYFFDAFVHPNETTTYYSFDYAGVHFVALDSEEYGIEGRITGPQYDWLVNELNSTSMPMKFVVVHRPLYPCSHIGSALDVNTEERDQLQELFEEQNVTMLIAGHDHLWNRFTNNGVVHMITGGAGAPLYSTAAGGDFNHYASLNVTSSQVNITAIGLDGLVKDGYTIPYEGPVEIFLREVYNNSQQKAGEMLKIYFSEVPVTQYYSWDGATNSTELTGLPVVNGLHTLDVYAENGESVWSHERYAFTTVLGVNPTTTTTTTSTASTTTTTTTPTGTGLDSMWILASAGIATAVVVVIVVIVAFKRR